MGMSRATMIDHSTKSGERHRRTRSSLTVAEADVIHDPISSGKIGGEVTNTVLKSCLDLPVLKQGPTLWFH
jgi:hypothetical protein